MSEPQHDAVERKAQQKEHAAVADADRAGTAHGTNPGMEHENRSATEHDAASVHDDATLHDDVTEDGAIDEHEHVASQVAPQAAVHDPIAKVAARKREERKENIVAILIVLLVVAAVAWFIWARLHPAASEKPLRVDVPIGESPMLGQANATHTVIVFTDFECPFCGTFARESMPVIKARYIDTGEARIVLKHFPLTVHPFADGAARAAACADEQGRFWEYHDLLFAHQDALDRASLVNYAHIAALNETRFVTCLTRLDEGTSIVDDDRLLGERIGVTGTPTFFFDGIRSVGALTPAEFGEKLVAS